MRQAEVDRPVERVEQSVQQRGKRRAPAAVAYLQRQFPAEAEQMKDELRGPGGGQ